MPQGNTKMLR